MVSRRPEAGSALGRGQRWGGSNSHRTSLLGQGVGTVASSPQDSGWCFHLPHTVPPLSLLSDRTLACRCSTTCRQTLSFWLAGWRCWRLSSGQVTLRHPHPQLCRPSLTFLTESRKSRLSVRGVKSLLVTELLNVATEKQICSYVWIVLFLAQMLL